MSRHCKVVVKQETKELTQNFHGNTSTKLDSSKHGNKVLKISFEAKSSEHVPLALEAAVSPHPPLPQAFNESLNASKPLFLEPTSKPFVFQDNDATKSVVAEKGDLSKVTESSCDDSLQLSVEKSCIAHSNWPFTTAHCLYEADDATIGKDKPVVAERGNLSKVIESSRDDSQLSIGKSCIVHSDRLFNTQCSVPWENCLVEKIAPGLYRKRLEFRNPYCSDDCTNLDVAEGATYSTEPQAAASLAVVKERKYFQSNENKTGCIIFTSDVVRFWKNFQYQLPKRNVEVCKIGKNGCVFPMFHFRQEYAVKKTVYRPKEIDVHSQLCHSNIINLEAVLVGEKHECDKGKLYVYHFMLKMDMSFADLLSTLKDSCLKHLKIQLIKKEVLWELVLDNVRHILKSVLTALKYMHSKKFVHRKIKESEILITRRCECNDLLYCTCHEQQKPVVKLGDFSSSSDVIGWESLFITAVDIWSFGYLLIAIFLGKHRPLALTTEQLLMEAQHYYGDNPGLCDLMHKCLQVHPYCRPTAEELLTLDFFTKPFC